MSDSNLTGIGYWKETEFGVLPDPAPAKQNIRFLSSSLESAKMTEMSEEIRSDRSRPELVQVGKSSSGDIATEFIVGGYDDFILAALGAAAWVMGSAVLTVNATAADNTLAITAGTLPAAAQGAKYYRVSGLAQAADNGVKRVVSAGDDSIVLDSVTADESAVEVTVHWRYARNGTTKVSFGIEQQYGAISSFIPFLGQTLNTWSLEMEARARLLQTFEFMGAEGLQASASSLSGSQVAETTRKICNTTGNIGALLWNGAALDANVMSFSLALGNNLRERPAISRETTLQHGTGRNEPDGTINTYFDSRDLYNAFLAHEDASLLLPITDPAGNLFSLWFPRLQFPSGTPTIEGINTDVMQELEFNATYHPTLGYHLQVDSVDVAGESS